MDATYRSLNYAFPQMSGGHPPVFQQAQPPKAGPNPFMPASQSPTSKLDAYFQDMKHVLGKQPSDNQLSVDDFQKYERLLQHAGELLDDTLQFSQRAESPTTAKYEAQKQDLMEKLSFTRQFSQFFQQQSQSQSQNSFNAIA